MQRKGGTFLVRRDPHNISTTITRDLSNREVAGGKRDTLVERKTQ